MMTATEANPFILRLKEGWKVFKQHHASKYFDQRHQFLLPIQHQSLGKHNIIFFDIFLINSMIS